MDSDDQFDDEEELQSYLQNEIRSNLNLDPQILEDTWKSYRSISVKYILEGNKMHWLACALYESCRKCPKEQMNGRHNNQQQQKQNEDQPVSLTRILRACDINLIKFFQKIKNWIDMSGESSLTIDLRKKIEQIEMNFNVTTVIFKKYRQIFEDVFKYPQASCRFTTKNRKIRKQPINSMDIYTFCWTLFVFVKSRFAKIGDDLVNSYHLLLVCIDYCFSSILLFANYRDIVNTNFYDELTKDYQKDIRLMNNDERISIIDTLCEKFNGIPVDVKHIRQHWFKSLINKLIDNNNLRKRANGIIDNDSIDFNYKYIRNEYEEFVLTVGDFDECIFLNDKALGKELGPLEAWTSSKYINIDDKINQQMQQQQQQNTGNKLIQSTPLSSRQYLATRTTPVKQLMTPISSAAASISRLHSILNNYKNEPSKELIRIYQMCQLAENPQEKISNILDKMGEIFMDAYCSCQQDQSVIRSNDEYQCIMINSGREFAERRRKFAETFFYYIFEKILRSELTKRIPESNMQQSLAKMLTSDILIRSLYACSLEIILFSYNICNRVFPWILQIYDSHPQLKIPPFFFYKVIEPIVREEQALSRDIVKHMSVIEEKILESMAWENDSPLWILLSKTRPPASAEVSLDNNNNLFNHNSQENASPFGKSFGSSAVVGGASNVKRQLFANNTNTKLPTTAPVAPSPTVDVSVIKSTKLTNSSTPIKQDISDPKLSSSSSILSTPVNRQQKNSQIALFFRKVYSLASHRFHDLFKRLQLKSEEIQNEIWTCFENVLRSHTYLMCGHHLDQIIMCCIYGIARIKGQEMITFQNITHKYRLQPQSNSLVYRNVLLAVNQSKKSMMMSMNNESNEPITIDDNDSSNAGSKYGSIIDFYNEIFVPNLSAYIMQLSTNDKNSAVKLIQMPRNELLSINYSSSSSGSSMINQSPLRCVPNFPVYISPLRHNQTTMSHNGAMMNGFGAATNGYCCSPNNKNNITYRFDQNNLTTNKDFEQINNIMKSSTVAAANNAASTMPITTTAPPSIANSNHQHLTNISGTTNHHFNHHNSHQHHSDMKASIATAMMSTLTGGSVGGGGGSTSSSNNTKRIISKRILQDDMNGNDGNNISNDSKKIPRIINLKLHGIKSDLKLIQSSSCSISGDESNDSSSIRSSNNGNLNILTTVAASAAATTTTINHHGFAGDAGSGGADGGNSNICTAGGSTSSTVVAAGIDRATSATTTATIIADHHQSSTIINNNQSTTVVTPISTTITTAPIIRQSSQPILQPVVAQIIHHPIPPQQQQLRQPVPQANNGALQQPTPTTAPTTTTATIIHHSNVTIVPPPVTTNLI